MTEWDGPVCWNEFEDCADDIEEAARDIADQLVDWNDKWTFRVYCCVKGGPVVRDLGADVIEWIDNDEDNSLACGDGLIQRQLKPGQEEELSKLIKDWVAGLGISMYRWAPGEPEMDITRLVKKAFEENKSVQASK